METKFGYFSKKKIDDKIKVVNKSTDEETPYDYYIGRPSYIGNPFSHLKHSRHAEHIVDTRDEAIDSYRDYFYEKIKTDPKFKAEIDKLIDFYKENGRINIQCWCHPKRCHGDIIKEYLVNHLKEG